MGRYLQQSESRSELQQRIAADLRAKAAAKAKQEGEIEPSERDERDEIGDSAYLKGTKSTTTLAPVWAMIFFVAVLVFIFFIYQANR